MTYQMLENARREKEESQERECTFHVTGREIASELETGAKIK